MSNIISCTETHYDELYQAILRLNDFDSLFSVVKRDEFFAFKKLIADSLRHSNNEEFYYVTTIFMKRCRYVIELSYDSRFYEVIITCYDYDKR